VGKVVIVASIVSVVGHFRFVRKQRVERRRSSKKE